MPNDTNETPWENCTRLEKTNCVVELLQASIEAARKKEFTDSFTVLFNAENSMTLSTKPSIAMIGVVFMAILDIAQRGNNNASTKADDLFTLLSLLKV